MRPCDKISTVSATVPTVLHDLIELSFLSNRDDLDTYRHCALAVLASDIFGEVDLLCDLAIFDRDASDELTHCSPPERLSIEDESKKSAQIVLLFCDAQVCQLLSNRGEHAVELGGILHVKIHTRLARAGLQQ